MSSPYLHNNSGPVQAYYRENCDAFRVKDDTYLNFIRAMKEKCPQTTGDHLTVFLWGIWRLSATNEDIRINGYTGETERNKGEYTSSCHISRVWWYAFQVDQSNTSRPAHSAEERDQVVERFKTATAMLLAA